MNVPSDRRIVLGLLVQPVLAFGLGVAVAAVRITIENGRSAKPVNVVIGFGIVMAVASAVASVVALPVIIWLRERGGLTLRRVLMTGLVLAAAPIALVVVATMATGNWRGTGIADVIVPAGLASFLGLACAGLFWFMACRQPAPRADALRRA